MHITFLFLFILVSSLSAIDEKIYPTDLSSINPSNTMHRLMQHPTKKMPDYFKYIRTQLVTILLEDSSTLYPKTISALARTNKAWAQVVREVTDKVFTSEGKKILSDYRPFLSTGTKINQKNACQFIEQVKITNYPTLLLCFKRLFAPDTGTDVNAKDKKKYGCTPLHCAAAYGRTEIVKILLSVGADIESKNSNGLTPLHYAADNGHPKTVKLLLDAGVDIDSKDNNGCTPLHNAALCGHPETVKLLLSAHANKDSKNNNDGSTPLHYAVLYGRAKVVKLLLDADADKDSKGEFGSTPLHYAALCGRTEIVKLLLDAGQR